MWKHLAIGVLIVLGAALAVTWLQNSGTALLFIPADRLGLRDAPRSSLTVTGTVLLPPLNQGALAAPAAAARTAAPAGPDALEAYRAIAADTIEASERTVELVKWLVTSSLALATIVITGAAYLYNKVVQATHDAKAAREEATAANRAVADIERAVAQAKEHAAAAEQQAKYAGDSARRVQDQADKVLSSATSSSAEGWRRYHTLLESATTMPEGAAKDAAYQEGAWAKYKENEDTTGLLELREHARRGLVVSVKTALYKELIRLERLGADRSRSQTRAYQEIGRIVGVETPAPPARNEG